MDPYHRPVYRHSDSFAAREAPKGTYIVIPWMRRERRAAVLAVAVALSILMLLIGVSS